MTEHRDWEKHRSAILARLDKGWAPAAIAAHYMVSSKTIQRLVKQWRPPAAPIAAEAVDQVAEPEPAPPAPIAADIEAPASPALAQLEALSGRPPDNTERNARILELAKEGLSAGQIGQRMGLTRSAVIGVLHRAGVSTKGCKRPRTTVVLPSKNQPAGASLEWAKGKNRNALVFAGGTKGDPKPPISRNLLNMQAPETAVAFEDRKGCRWPFGDPREGPLLYCNAPTCRVRNGDLVQPTNYCAEHWALRRSSAYTRIIAASPVA
jgi:hypothetical protein